MKPIRAHPKGLLKVTVGILIVLTTMDTLAQQPVARLSTKVPLYDIAWSPDDQLLAVAGQRGLTIYTQNLGEVALLQYDTGNVYSVSWSPNGDRLASTSADGPVFIWVYDRNTNTFTLQTTLSVEYEPQVVVAWSPNGNRLATESGVSDGQRMLGKVYVWNTTTWILDNTLPEQYSYTTAPPNALEWSPDSTLVAGAGFDQIERENVVFISSALTGERVRLIYHVEMPLSLAWHTNGLIATAARSYVDIGNAIDEAGHSLQAYNVASIDWSPDGSKLALVNGDTVEIRDVANDQVLAVFPHGVGELDWNSDGTQIATGSRDGVIEIWDVSSLVTMPTPVLVETPTPADEFPGCLC